MTNAASTVRPTDTTARSVPDTHTITEAYIYLLSRALVVRQEHLDLREPGVTYNTIKCNPLGSADFVNPNFDVAYLEAWLAADDRTPVLLDVPEITGRYYTAQILDEWGEVIANINERRFPTKPFGRFALVKPGSNPTLPRDASRIALHSSKAKLLARVELKGDPDGAVRLQKAFRISVSGTPAIEKPVDIPIFDNKDLIGVEIFERSADILASALDVAPNAAEMQEKVRAVAAHVASDQGARAAVEALVRAKVVPEFKEYAQTKVAPVRHRWIGGVPLGNYGADYRLRTTGNLMGIWANTPDEVLYWGTFHGPDGKPLDGGKSYVMHFPPDGLPDSVVDSYWSVILVSVPDYRVVANPLNRFNFNDGSPLRKEADGSLKIAVGPQSVAGIPDSNWLPSARGKPFSLTFRTYVPKDAARAGWAPPALTPID